MTTPVTAERLRELCVQILGGNDATRVCESSAAQTVARALLDAMEGKLTEDERITVSNLRTLAAIRLEEPQHNKNGIAPDFLKAVVALCDRLASPGATEDAGALPKINSADEEAALTKARAILCTTIVEPAPAVDAVVEDDVATIERDLAHRAKSNLENGYETPWFDVNIATLLHLLRNGTGSQANHSLDWEGKMMCDNCGRNDGTHIPGWSCDSSTAPPSSKQGDG